MSDTEPELPEVEPLSDPNWCPICCEMHPPASQVEWCKTRAN